MLWFNKYVIIDLKVCSSGRRVEISFSDSQKYFRAKKGDGKVNSERENIISDKRRNASKSACWNLRLEIPLLRIILSIVQSWKYKRF